MSHAISPLERPALLALISLIRDREPDPDFWVCTYVPLNAVYNATLSLKPDASYELQKRNHRQAMRRALGRLHTQGLVYALALGWVSVGGQELIEWQGGGRRKREPGDANPRGYPTPRWKRVSLSTDGVALALALERETQA